jgi:hypothetical protein
MGKTERKGKSGSDGTVRETLTVPFEPMTLRILEEEFLLDVGHLNPMKSTPDGGVSGVKARLADLGYYLGETDGTKNNLTNNAIRRFQFIQRTDPNGKIEDPLMDKLTELFGC